MSTVVMGIWTWGVSASALPEPLSGGAVPFSLAFVCWPECMLSLFSVRR